MPRLPVHISLRLQCQLEKPISLLTPAMPLGLAAFAAGCFSLLDLA